MKVLFTVSDKLSPYSTRKLTLDELNDVLIHMSVYFNNSNLLIDYEIVSDEVAVCEK